MKDGSEGHPFFFDFVYVEIVVGDSVRKKSEKKRCVHFACAPYTQTGCEGVWRAIMDD